MNKEEVENFLISFFKNKNDNLSNVDLFENYFERELVDSFGIIEMVEELEAHFNISFSPEDFHKRSFQTIDGLADIILMKTKCQ